MSIGNPTGPEVIRTSVVWVVVATFAVILRLLARWLSRASFAVDDLLIVVSLLPQYGMMVVGYLGEYGNHQTQNALRHSRLAAVKHAGLGKPIVTVSPSQINQLLKVHEYWSLAVLRDMLKVLSVRDGRDNYIHTYHHNGENLDLVALPPNILHTRVPPYDLGCWHLVSCLVHYLSFHGHFSMPSRRGGLRPSSSIHRSLHRPSSFLLGHCGCKRSPGRYPVGFAGANGLEVTDVQTTEACTFGCLHVR